MGHVVGRLQGGLPRQPLVQRDQTRVVGRRGQTAADAGGGVSCGGGVVVVREVWERLVLMLYGDRVNREMGV